MEEEGKDREGEGWGIERKMCYVNLKKIFFGIVSFI
jgi:hypothetical protein